ncbi:chorismate mutase [Blattabacterium cuenoti]|nr:chorismate mutase [Blattabacterium cuenoti]
MDVLNKNIDRSWIDNCNNPFIISGPCSAESKMQIFNTANGLLKNEGKSYVHAFRAGIWKPRTKPGNFEGIGIEGLKWLREVKKNNGIYIATEVANKEHVKLCINHDVDILWIGARSTTNPFLVQEIADSLVGQNDKIVLVKNPIHPDIELWIGAVERLYKKGIRKIGLIHRGFYTYKSLKYRNQPNWKLVLEIKNIIPEIPILCDPSHICGNRDRLFDISNKSIRYFNCDGLMIESHYDPSKAWSDSNQQITPDILLDFLKSFYSNSNKDYITKNQRDLESFRLLIDELDENIISILSERMNISRKLGIIKKNLDINILQPNRWNIIMKQSINLGKDLGIPEQLLKNIFKLLHQESIKIQNKTMK